ncbi:MAG: phosphotransacetylase family protein [Actinomycetota bacterium]|nr:phosphotransacetylase family protein [Actinomycetota bacterium]
MVTLLTVSSENYSGKTTILMGLALELKSRGYTIGYMKPVGGYPIKTDNGKIDPDAIFARQVLELSEKSDEMTLFHLTRLTISRYMRKRPDNTGRRLSNVHRKLSSKNDVVFVEGPMDLSQGKILGLSAPEIAALLGSKVLLLETFDEEVMADRILSARDRFGGSFLGVILNWVPEGREEFVRNLMSRFLAEEGIQFFGYIPVDNVLRSITINDLVSFLEGEVVCAEDRCEELIETMMVGAMGERQALELFRRRENKVVITGGDRSDIQLAALSTPTKCIILTGGLRPSPAIIAQASELGVPIVVVKHDTATAVEMVEDAISRQKVSSVKKIERIRFFIRKRIMLDSLLSALELPDVPK